MPLYNLIEYRDSYSKTSGRLWKYYRDEPAINNNGVITDSPSIDSTSFTAKRKIADLTGNDATKDI